MNYDVSLIPTLHFCQNGGPDGPGDTLIQFVPSFRGTRVVTTLRAWRLRNQEFDSRHGENFSFPWALRSAQTAIQHVCGTVSPRQRGPGCERDHYQLHLGQEVNTVSSYISSSQYDCRTQTPQAVYAMWFMKIFFLSVTNQTLIPRSSSLYGCHYVGPTSQRKSISYTRTN
jgi:hypothetical protein